MQSTRLWSQSVMLLALLSGAGCSGGVSVYPVEGTVMYNGKPMQGGGTIAFVPLGKQEGKTAAGEIDENGKYSLMTYRPGDGSMVGEFRVVVTQVTEKEPEASQDGQAVSKSAGSVPPALRIPMVYSDHHGSPLKATVEAKSKNEINFDLKPMAPVVNQGA